MKKSVILLLILTITISLSGCSLLDKTDEKLELSSEELKEVVMIDNESKMFTKDTLPEEYNDVDLDMDALTNAEEIQYGTDMYVMDTDSDGLADGTEVRESKTSPLKWSSRDDDISDLRYYVTHNNVGFKPTWTGVNQYNIRVYLAKPEDYLYIFSKVSTDVFDGLETISEATQIKDFSGKLAVDTSNFIDEVAHSIAVYKATDTDIVKIDTFLNGDRLLEFIVSDGDTIVLAYEPQIAE